MDKKRIKFFRTFEELEKDAVQQNLAMTLEERWGAFWKMKKAHSQLFNTETERKSESSATKKRIIFSKPGWI